MLPLTSTELEERWDELRAEAERGRIRAIEFHIEKLKHGLAMPPDPEALAYYEGLLRDLRKRAASDREA